MSCNIISLLTSRFCRRHLGIPGLNKLHREGYCKFFAITNAHIFFYFFSKNQSSGTGNTREHYYRPCLVTMSFKIFSSFKIYSNYTRKNAGSLLIRSHWESWSNMIIKGHSRSDIFKKRDFLRLYKYNFFFNYPYLS